MNEEDNEREAKLLCDCLRDPVWDSSRVVLIQGSSGLWRTFVRRRSIWVWRSRVMRRVCVALPGASPASCVLRSVLAATVVFSSLNDLQAETSGFAQIRIVPTGLELPLGWGGGGLE